MIAIATIPDLHQLRFEIEQALLAVPPLQIIFFKFERYEIPMEFTISAAKKLVDIVDSETRTQSTCMVYLKEDKKSVVQVVDRGIFVEGKRKFRL